MKWTEKTAVIAVLASLAVSSIFFGVREDKVPLFAPLLTLIYLAGAVWAVSRCRSDGVREFRSKRSAEDGSQRTEDGGQGSEVRGQETEDRGQRSEIRGQETEDRGQRSGVRRQRTEVRGQRSEIRGQRSDGDNQKSEIRNQKSSIQRSQASPLTTWQHNNITTEPAMPDVPTSDLRPPTSGSRIPPGGILLLLFWLFSAAMIPFSVLPYEAKISTLRFGCYLITYWMTANILSRFPARKIVWTTVFTLLILIALYSLVQHKIAPGELFGMARYTKYWEDGRLGGTYQCPNHIAHLFQMWIPLCFVFLFLPQFGWFWRICFAYALALFLVLIYQTQSRASLLGTIAAIGVTVLFMILRKSRRTFCVALLVVPLLTAGAVGGLWAGSSMFRTRMQPVIRFAEQCFSGDLRSVEFEDIRPRAWMDTLPMLAARPSVGLGPGNYGLVYEKYRKRVQAVRIEMVHPHNEYLELLAEYGVVGGLLAFSAVLSLSVQLIRFIRTSPRAYHALPAVALLGAMAGTAVHGFFDFELRIFPNALMLAFLAGCAVAPIFREQKAPVSPTSDRRPLTSVLCLLTSVFLLLAALWSVQVMSSAWIRARGDQLLLDKKYDQAEQHFKLAGRIDPQNWQAHLGLAQVYYFHRYDELNPVPKKAWALKEQAAYSAACRINPIEEEVTYGLGRVELFLGNRDQGLDYLRQAADYKRFNDFYWRKLGIELRKAGLYDEALTAFQHAQKLDRSNKTVQRNLQWLKARKTEVGGQKTEAGGQKAGAR